MKDRQQTVWNRSRKNDLMPFVGRFERAANRINNFHNDWSNRLVWFGSHRLTHLLSGLGIRVAFHEGHEEEKGTDGHGIVGGLLGYCLTKRWLDVGARPHDASQSYPTIYGGSHKEETEQTKSAKQKETIPQLAPAVTTPEMHLISLVPPETLHPVVGAECPFLDQRLLDEAAAGPQGTVWYHAAQHFVFVCQIHKVTKHFES